MEIEKPSLNLAERALSNGELAQLLDAIRSVSVAVIGDFCLDVYWHIDPSGSEPSVETGLPTRPVRTQRPSLGGAGNVTNNLTSLGAGRVDAYGVIGDDPWGPEMIRLLHSAGVDTANMLTQPGEDWFTNILIKPLINNEETNRVDFGNFNKFYNATADLLLNRLEEKIDSYNAVIINQQALRGIHTDYFRPRLHDLILRHPQTHFIVDSRSCADAYPGACLKLNAHEATGLMGAPRPLEEPVPREAASQAADALFARQGRPIFVTRGTRGVLVRDALGFHEIPGLQILARTDPVGAGDSMISGIAAALAAGRRPAQAAAFGNFVAGVTVQKLLVTGTASPAEILSIGTDPDYIYRPELAEDPRGARYAPESFIEIVTTLRPNFRPRVAIFDHDGTVSTLREGWERIMEPVMVQAILGERYGEADESLYLRVLARVRDYIDKSTGIQTLAQMQGLVKMVHEFGCVSEEKILDEFGYKNIYNKVLMTTVGERVAKFRRGELALEDFTIKNSVEFLRHLKAAGVRLVLASGTDQQDVIDEARELGYADFFDGGIYGSVGDVKNDAKKIVLERILKDIGAGMADGLVTFGDGPVEMRETHKRGGFAIGVASDEVRRFGLNLDKRARLIRAGADLIIPDFSQLEPLLSLLNIG